MALKEKYLSAMNVTPNSRPNNIYLKKHITGVHNRGRKFKCEKCNVELKTPQGLKWHLKIHDREM